MTRRLRFLIALGLGAITLWYLAGDIGLYSPRMSSHGYLPAARVDPHNTTEHIDFWREFHSLLLASEPKCKPPRRTGHAPATGFNPSEAGPRPDLLKMPTRDVWRMKRAHEKFVENIQQSPPSLSYLPGTRGLVTTAGGSYLPVLVISLRMLRRTGSQLPMEVFLATPDEYEEFICDQVLPSLNAKCVVLTEITNAVPGGGQIEKYQLKPFAMIFSSFEEILFLDADAFPIAKPESLFEQQPFQSANLITWPDFWASSASPYYYDIASQNIPAMTSRQSTESGEVLISKKTHLKTLLLCTYYNFWGPTHYYRLLSQGAAGEGDKETFISAATAVGEPFYQVREPICAMGHATKGGLAGSAMLQFDPIEDYRLAQTGELSMKGSTKAAPKAFFIHANFPKFNPATVFTKQAVNPAFNDDGTYTRAWTTPQEKIEAFGSDVEKQFWAEILWTGCELENKFRAWENRTDICNGVKQYWAAQFGSEDPSRV
ncbi:hypothetical protein N7456_012703 [Penicillium angulare]|uniref:Alpha-mannosyltransferase n=1 Tax=Penicillium angulare TaxID=116970 RepID=A0A9W9EKC2_9EURO|nr:hypothetical protein N7456_012703 [Penicillium angulare]